MSFRKRMVVSFFIVILIPLLLMIATLAGGYFFIGPAAIEGGMNMLLLMGGILIITAIILYSWLDTGITKPLNHLTKVTKQLGKGDLDTPIEEEGSDEFRELCRELERMRVRLKEANEAKLNYDKESKELISNISHDLRTPIATVKGYVEGIMDGVAATPEKMDKYIKTIYTKTNEMERLINELTIYSKIDTDRMPYTFTKVNVKDFFDKLSEDLRIELESQNIFYSYNNEVGEKELIIGDVEQIRRVVNNIMSNSLKYMDKPQRKIDLTVEDAEDMVHVKFRDNGKGIPKTDIANIFNRFYRSDTSRNSSTGGSGIGLSIVKKIMEDHGGRAWVTSTEGEETTMHLEFRKYKEVRLYEQDTDN